MSDNAILVLEDGTVFKGRSIGATGQAVGEVVFNTSITGYQEILTDPSYARQFVTLTYPHIGNVGTNDQDNESKQVFLSGLIVRDCAKRVSNWRSQQTLSDFLQRFGVVGISDIDTRMLTRLIRRKGAQNACLMAGEIDEKSALSAAHRFPGLRGMDLAQVVSTDESYEWTEGGWQDGQFNLRPEFRFKVVAYDYGIKRNILRMLTDRHCDVTVVPASTSATEVLSMQPDGVFLSNGPGDPEPCEYAVSAIQRILSVQIPIFGICLGHQLLALALGARTEKMKFGHHGANHPVQEISTGRVFITSQNHGFTVDETSLPAKVRVTHRSLFDGTLQGIESTQGPAFSFQGHPEASPGPHDIGELFDQFITLMEGRAASSATPA